MLAGEIEFYLLNTSADEPTLLAALAEACEQAALPVDKIEKERGNEQYEIALRYSNNLLDSINKINSILAIAEAVAKRYGGQASFAAKPLADQPGSGLHLHLHLEDANGRNLFTRADDDSYSLPLLHTIGGILQSLAESVYLLAPRAESYARFEAGNNVPLTASWGPNNRTVALRLPDKPLNNKHIEYRVPGADSDALSAVTVLLMGTHYGLSQKVIPSEPVYGNASLPMYPRPSLPRSLEQAKTCFEQGFILRNYFKN